MLFHLSLSSKNRIRLIGIILFYSTLIFNLGLIIILKVDWNLAGPYNLVAIFVTYLLCVLSAASSSFVTSYLSCDRREGLRTVFITGLLIEVVYAALFLIFLFYLLTTPPRDIYEPLAQGGIFIAFMLFFIFILIPISELSVIFAVIFANLGYHLVKLRKV